MSKKAMIRQICQQTIDEYAEIKKTTGSSLDEFELEKGRAEFAEEVLEILNGGDK